MPRLSWTTVTPLLAAVALTIAWPLHPDSAPVLSGSTTTEEARRADPKPTHVADSLAALVMWP